MFLKNIYQVISMTMVILLASSTMAIGSEHSSEMSGYIHLKTENNIAFRVYTAGPEQAKQGLLLVHGWLGLNREMEMWANKFAVKGYRVMAIDLYNNQVAQNPKKARQLMNSVDQDTANAKYVAALKALAVNGRKVAVVGRSFGANQAIKAASVGADSVSAVVIYYPFGETGTDKQTLSLIKMPVLGNFATNDFFFDQTKQDKFVATARNQGVKLIVENYSAQHGFTNMLGKNFDAESDKQSNQKTLSFLKANLH